MKVTRRIHRGFFSRLMYRMGWRGYTWPLLRSIHVGLWCDTDDREHCIEQAHHYIGTKLVGSWMLACAIGSVAHEESHVEDAERLGPWRWWPVKLWEIVTTPGSRADAMEAKAYAAGRAARDAAWNGVP